MEDQVTVTVSQGTLRGKKNITKCGSSFISFWGIPYAKPPVGPLRFKPPMPAHSWTGVRDALEEPPICTQNDFFIGSIRGVEDCLYLNVFTSQLPPDGSLKPVMVWIHGGGFTMGSGNADFYGADFLVDSGVVVVTFNYRLGPLGFLSLGNEAVPGNMGLKDQVSALHWVQQNIHCFGGDPNNVTIFGESAGGSSVHYLLLSPMSKGLFKQAIAQSGSAFNPWAFTSCARARAFRLGEELDCKTDDPQVLLDFLMTVEPEALVKAADKTVTKVEKMQGLPFPFKPSIEPQIMGLEAFLTKEPISVIMEGKIHQVPLIAGVTSHEGMGILKEVLTDESMLNQVDNNFQKVVSGEGGTLSQELSNKIRKFYFGNKPISKETLLEYVNMNTDILFATGVDRMVKQQATLSSAPVYYYQFLFDGNLGHVKKYIGCENMPGTCHGDDLGYLFNSSLSAIKVDPKSPEGITRSRMIKLWTNFAKTGNPTPELDDVIKVQWPPYTTSNPRHLKIDAELSIGQEVEKERMNFWEDLYCSKL